MKKHVRRSAALVAIVASAIAIATASTPTPAATAQSACGDLQRVVIAGVATCTHGGDEPVPDVVATGSRSLATRSATPPAPCPGNGHGGRRIRVLLGYPSDTTAPDAASARPMIRQALALADQNLDGQSPEVGQHYRFWCGTDRAVTITTVRLSAIGADNTYTFANVANALDAKGYDDPAFVYVAFVANIDCCYPYGGQGSLALDDQPDPSYNANNGLGTRYSMIRFGLGYATGSLALAFQHETHDTMCYNDGGSYFAGGGTLTASCPDVSPTGMYAFDCHGDDYYNVAPAPSTYIADHWNVADSSWLTPVGASGK